VVGTLLLSREDIRDLISIEEVVEVVEKTFKDMGEGGVINPAKLHLDLGDGSSGLPYKAGMNAMPAYIGWQKVAGIKFIGGWEDNPSKGLPYIRGMIILVNPEDGQFLSVMDGGLITAMRTGAQVAVALKYLMIKKERPVIALFGAGTQGRTQLLAISSVFDIKEFRVYDINKDAAMLFLKEMSPMTKAPIKLFDSPQEATDGADAVVSVTHAKNKFIRKEMFKEGVTLCPLGSFSECADDVILSADKIVVDHVEQCLHRGALKELVGAGAITAENIYGTLGEVVAGKKHGRTKNDEKILCVTIGTGAMDVSVASMVYRRAMEKGKGVSFSF